MLWNSIAILKTLKWIERNYHWRENSEDGFLDVGMNGVDHRGQVVFVERPDTEARRVRRREGHTIPLIENHVFPVHRHPKDDGTLHDSKRKGNTYRSPSRECMWPQM